MGEAIKKGSKYGWVVLLVTFLAGFTAPANMAKVTALAPVIMGAFGIDPTALGWIIASFYILGFVLAFPAAGLVNKFGIRKIVVVAIICGALGSLLGVLTSSSLVVFVISRVLEGAGMGIMGVAGASAIAPWFPAEKRGLPLGLWAMWVALAMFLCPMLYTWLVDTVGMAWQSIWWGTLIFDVAILILFLAFYRDAPAGFNGEECVTEEKPRITAVFKNKTLWVLALIFFFDECAFMAVNGFFTTYLTDPVGANIPLTLAGIIASAAAILGTIFAPIGGKISDILHTRKKVLIFGICGGIAYTCLVFNMHSAAPYIGIVILGGIAGGLVPSIIWGATPEAVDRPDLVPSANAFVAFTQNFGMFIGAMAMGTAITSLGWTAASFVVLVPCYVICLILALVGLKKLR